MIKHSIGRLVMLRDGVRKAWKEYFEDLHNVDAEEYVCVVLIVLGGEVFWGMYCGGLKGNRE